MQRMCKKWQLYYNFLFVKCKICHWNCQFCFILEKTTGFDWFFTFTHFEFIQNTKSSDLIFYHQYSISNITIDYEPRSICRICFIILWLWKYAFSAQSVPLPVKPTYPILSYTIQPPSCQHPQQCCRSQTKITQQDLVLVPWQTFSRYCLTSSLNRGQSDFPVL